MRPRPARASPAGLLLACAGWLNCSAPLPSPPPVAPPSPSPAPSPVAAPPPPERARCRPEIRGQRGAGAASEAALGDFFDRVLSGDDWRVAIEERPPEPSLLVAEVRRLKACPRFYEVTSQRTTTLSDGLLTFDEPEIGTLAAGFVVRDGRIVPHLYTLERSFRAGIMRAELEPFLERSPEWIPSGGATCPGATPDEEKTFALFRGPRTNVLCVVRGDASRCFELPAGPGGWLYLEVGRGERCGIGTNAVVGPDLNLQIVPSRQRPWQRGEGAIPHVGAAPQDGTMSNRLLPRAWTDLPSRWSEVDPARFPLRAAVDGIWEERREDVGPGAPPAILGWDLFCLRLDGVWRCSARNEGWPAGGPIGSRTGAGGTVVSIVSNLHEPDAGPFEDSRVLTFARGEGRRLVDLGRFPIGASVTDVAPGSDGVQTNLELRWELTHEQPRCVHVTRARARLRRSHFVGDRFESHDRDVAVVYGPAPPSVPRRAPRLSTLDPFHPSRPVEDLRGSWRLEGESWRRVPSCIAP